MTAHIDALELQRTLDAYFNTLEGAGKPLPKATAVKKAQLRAWLRTFETDSYRGVKLEPIPERRGYRKKDTASFA